MGHFGQSKPSTCTCYSLSPPSLVLPRSDVSRSRPTVVLPRATMTLRPGATITPSQQTSRFTIRVCTKLKQAHNHPSILQLLNLYHLQTKRLELLSKWFCYKNTSVSVIKYTQ